MKPILRALPALAVRGALIWGAIGVLGVAVLGGVSERLRQPGAPEPEVAVSGITYIISVLCLAASGAVSGSIYALLLALHWHSGERAPGPVDDYVGRSQTIAEHLSFVPMLACACVLGAIALVLVILPSSSYAIVTVAVFGGVMGLGGGAALAALATGIVDRF